MAGGPKKQNKKARAKAKELLRSPSPISPTYREPSGRPQRKQGADTVTKAEAKANRKAAFAGRVNVFGLSKEAAEKQEAGTWVGRLFLAGKIPARVYDALTRYAEVCEAMSRVCGTPRVKSGSAVEGFGGFDGRSGDDPDYIEWVARVREQYAGARSALLHCRDPLAHMIVDGAIRDDPLGDWLDTIIAGGHALGDYFGFPEDKENAA